MLPGTCLESKKGAWLPPQMEDRWLGIFWTHCVRARENKRSHTWLSWLVLHLGGQLVLGRATLTRTCPFSALPVAPHDMCQGSSSLVGRNLLPKSVCFFYICHFVFFLYTLEKCLHVTFPSFKLIKKF